MHARVLSTWEIRSPLLVVLLGPASGTSTTTISILIQNNKFPPLYRSKYRLFIFRSLRKAFCVRKQYAVIYF